MKKICFTAMLLSGFLFAGYVPEEASVMYDGNGNYDLVNPHEKHVLPPVLNEISGLTDINEKEVGCVQDEMGVIFIYNLREKKVVQQVSFGSAGDYEGIARVKNDMYVLRSDGTLIEVKNYRSKSIVNTVYALHLPTSDNEGLCYDEKNNRLLIAAKSKAGKGKGLKDTRLVYAFDLAQKKLAAKPLMEIDIAELAAFAARRNIQLPAAPKKKGEGTRTLFRFMPSSIEVHPFTGNIYVISAIDHTLATFDASGKVIDFHLLDKRKFNKPEGLAFMANGDLLVSNEAEGADPTIFKYVYNKN